MSKIFFFHETGSQIIYLWLVKVKHIIEQLYHSAKFSSGRIFFYLPISAPTRGDGIHAYEWMGRLYLCGGEPLTRSGHSCQVQLFSKLKCCINKRHTGDTGCCAILSQVSQSHRFKVKSFSTNIMT